MALSIGIVGLPNVGKSTLFQALTRKKVDIANYPFCTIDPNVGIVKVPDERLGKLAVLLRSAKIIPAVVEFVDIAGLVRGANKGEGLGNQFLANIREVDAIVQVVRCFEDPDIVHVEQGVDPIRDMETIQTELILKDLETITKRLFNLEREVRGQKKEAVEEVAMLQDLQSFMNKGKPSFSFMQEHLESTEILKPLFLLSAKPILYLFNANSSNEATRAKEKANSLGAPFVVVNLKEELDVAGLALEEIKELGLKPSRLGELIAKSYQLLDLITFFTTGPDETRAWTIRRGEKAPQAGGVIHSDFEKKFIKALVIPWDKLFQAGSIGEAMTKGWIRTEGKEYVVRDGDVIEIKHS
ncbi:MAG: redox-regulated ATPase YchF [Patescibacteria group bacterium]